MTDEDTFTDLFEAMPDDLTGDEMVEFTYKAQRAMLDPVPELPGRALTPKEVDEYLTELGYGDNVTAWLPNEEGLEHEGLLEHRAEAHGDVLRVYIEHDRRTELYTLLPLEDDGFEWHYNDNPNDGIAGSTISTMKRQMGWKELAKVLDDGEYPNVPQKYVSAASFFNAESTPTDYTPYLPDEWVITQASRHKNLSRFLHPVYEITLVHRPTETVVMFVPAPIERGPGEPGYYMWEVDALTGNDAALTDLDDVFDNMITGDEALQLVLRVDDSLTGTDN